MNRRIVAFAALKYAAAAYLVYLGIMSLRAGNAPLEAGEVEAHGISRRWFLQGFINNVLNPKGALFYLGDCHATQGDGELCGVAVEIASTTTVQVDLIKQWRIDWPRLENADCIMTIGSARPMEDAARIAYRELVRWLEADYGWDRLEAYLFLTQAGRIRLGNMVDPKYTLGASVLKAYLR